MAVCGAPVQGRYKADVLTLEHRNSSLNPPPPPASAPYSLTINRYMRASDDYISLKPLLQHATNPCLPHEMLVVVA